MRAGTSNLLSALILSWPACALAWSDEESPYQDGTNGRVTIRRPADLLKTNAEKDFPRADETARRRSTQRTVGRAWRTEGPDSFGPGVWTDSFPT